MITELTAVVDKGVLIGFSTIRRLTNSLDSWLKDPRPGDCNDRRSEERVSPAYLLVGGKIHDNMLDRPPIRRFALDTGTQLPHVHITIRL